MGKYICKICGKEFSKSGLAKHYTKKHNLPREQIYDYLYPEEIGTHICPICGKPLKINKRELKYNEFCSVKCAQQYNWSDPEKKEKQSKNLKLFWGDESNYSVIRKHMQETWKNKTDEEKKLFHDKSSKSHKLMFQNKSPEELKEWRDNISNGKKLAFKFYSEEQMNNFSQARKLVWASKSPEEQQEWVSKIKSTWDSKSPEELEEFSRIQSSHWLSKSPEEQQEWVSKIKSTWGSKSPEELEELSSKISSAWFSKTNEEKLELSNKKRINKISLEQYQTLNNKDKFKQYLVGYKDMNGGYPTPDNLKEYFKFSNTSGVLLYIHQYNLEDYISWDKSIPEQEVYDYIRSIYGGEIITNNRFILSNNKELDIYIPKKNLAIEFDGCYWHSKLWKDNHYHQNKSKECLSKNIRLIHIYEDEWIYKRDIVKDIIKSALGVFENKIYARDCIIKKVDKQTYKNMCQYHLQGYSPAQIILGLYYQDQLIQLASFSKSRYDKNYEYEWIRGVQLPNYQIIGGTSKLFKYFIKNYNPESIICYSDFNKFSGNSYKNCGFTLDKITTPDMWFNEINGLKRINRQPSKHQLTKSLVESGDLLEMHGAGNMKWVWRK